MPCPAPIPLHVLLGPQPRWFSTHRFQATFTFPSATHLGIRRSQGDPARGAGSLRSWPRVPKLMAATVGFSLDGASGWVLANLSSLLEVPLSQNYMKKECDPMQCPWLLRAHLWKGQFLFNAEERRFQ